MRILVGALARAIARLPTPCADAPKTYSMAVQLAPFSDAEKTAAYQRVTFKLEQFVRQNERWFEWVIEINQSG